MTQSRSRFACLVVLMLALGLTLPAVSGAAELIVQRDAGLSAGERADVRSDAGVAFKRTALLPRSEIVSVPDGREQAALAALKADPRVDSAVPNVKLHVAGTQVLPLTGDPWAYFQWDLENSADADIDLRTAWSVGPDPGNGVEVAVVDQLVHDTHEDLGCPSTAPDTCRDQIDHDAEKNFVTGTTCTASQPLVDHATHVAGTIAAKRNNGAGITGIAPYARIVPVQAFDNCGDGDPDQVLAAFRYAASKASVVTGSFATDSLDADKSGWLNNRFADILDDFPDTLFVVAAGNEGSDNSELPVYPCDTRIFGRSEPSNLICVAMSDDHDKPSCQSNVRGSADVFAPGVDIWAPIGAGRTIDRLSGTSQAAAVVAGVAALAEWFEPSWNGDQLKDAIVMNADPIAGMDGLVTSNGRVNAARALGLTKDESGRDLGHGYPNGGTWTSCDADHDGVTDSLDACPARPGPLESGGCDDPDRDGLLDDHDNCPDAANADQANMDQDAFGDVCDSDQDGDLRAETVDVCPRQYALTANGCPQVDVPPEPTVVPPTPIPSATPTPTPGVTPQPTPVAPAALRVTIAVKVSRKVAKVTVKPTRAGRFWLRIDHLDGKRWKRVKTRVVSAPAAGKVTKFKLPKGRYRVTATASGVKQTTKTFKV